MHRKGFHISWNKRIHSSSSENQQAVIEEDTYTQSDKVYYENQANESTKIHSKSEPVIDENEQSDVTVISHSAADFPLEGIQFR